MQPLLSGRTFGFGNMGCFHLERVALLLLFSSALPQCGAAESKECTAIAIWSFRVHVRDSSTGAEMCDATVIASDGATDTPLSCVGEDGPYVGVAEQLGTFQITAAKSDYRDGSTTIVVDQSDGCHVVTKDATLELDPL